MLNLYQHINAPEARMYLSRQLYEEALHVQFYLTLLDTYVPDPARARAAFAAVENIPSIQREGRVLHALDGLDPRARRGWRPREHRRQFLLNLICFAACIEGLFFFGAFAYVYFLRSRGLLHGLAAGTNWVFRDESAHMAFAFEVVRDGAARGARAVRRRVGTAGARRCWTRPSSARRSSPRTCWAAASPGCRCATCASTWSTAPTSAWPTLGLPRATARRTRLRFMDLQDVQEVTNFFERRVSAYQVGVTGDVVLDAAF